MNETKKCVNSDYHVCDVCGIRFHCKDREKIPFTNRSVRGTVYDRKFRRNVEKRNETWQRND